MKVLINQNQTKIYKCHLKKEKNQQKYLKGIIKDHKQLISVKDQQAIFSLAILKVVGKIIS